MSNQKEKNHQGSMRGKGIFIMIAFAVLFAALAVCIVLLLRKQEADPIESGASTILERGFVDEDNVDEIMDEMADKVAEGMFECMMTTTWAFADGTSASPNAYVANVESNRYTLCFDVYESATNELLYSSPLIPVGKDIDNIKLDKELSAGDYDAVVMYTLVDEENKEVSSVGFNITISVAK